MSPKNLKELKKIRKKLDKLDDSFIKLIKKRTNLVKQVLKLKENKNQIIDNKRIKWIKNFDSIKKGPVIFFGNEFFDAIPIKQFSKKVEAAKRLVLDPDEKTSWHWKEWATQKNPMHWYNVVMRGDPEKVKKVFDFQKF